MKRELVDTIDRLNDEQYDAVVYPATSLLVLAGAGSGKTSVLTARIAALVDPQQICEGAAFGLSPTSILAVTFTNKAAEEMRERLRGLIDRESVAKMTVGTFHSVCLRMLRDDPEAAGIHPKFSVIDPDAQESLIKGLQTLLADVAPSPLGEIDGDDEDDDSALAVKAKEIVAWINSKKERGVTSSEVAMDDKLHPGEAYRNYFYKAYEDECRQQGLLDFNDLLSVTVNMLERNAEVREKYRNKYRGVLIDEWQDTNVMQYRWLQLIVGKDAFVMAVGDDDQSIYSFRGARPENMRAFVKDFKAEIIRLTTNYRSLPHILGTANWLIKNNDDRLGKDLVAHREGGGEVIITDFENKYEEAREVAQKVKALVTPTYTENGERIEPAYKCSDVAILYRTNRQSRDLEAAFNKLNIPVTVYGGFRFFERQEVKRVLAYLDLISNMDRDISFKAIVNFPRRELGDSTIDALAREAREAGHSMMRQIFARSERAPESLGNATARKKQLLLEQFLETILDMTLAAETMSLPEAVQMVIERSGIAALYKSEGDEGEERLAHLGELVMASAEFEKENPEFRGALELIPEYLAYAQLMSSTADADMSQKNTVSLMTIHASKGLEFHNVFLVGFEEGLFPSSRAIEEDGGENEERRLAYVAITRAKTNLQISHAITSIEYQGKRQVMKPVNPSMFLYELPKDHIKYVTGLPKLEAEDAENTAVADEKPVPGKSLLLDQSERTVISGGKPGELVRKRIFRVGNRM